LANDRLIAISKLMSLMLRHEPAKFGLILDAEGFAPFEEVLAAVQTRLPETAAADLLSIVETLERDKQRFTIVDGDIRANYGHSLADRIAHSTAIPPARLFHGTHAAAVDAILREGLRPMKRQYVHLTPNLDLASRVGAPRGKPQILEVDATAAHAAGIQFHRANENFWLVNDLPARFLRGPSA